MKIQLWMVGLLAIASASCAAEAVTNATSPAPISPPAIAVPSADSTNISRQEALAGTWSAGLMTVTFNWNAGTYSGVMLGEPFSKDLKFISETENEVVFETDGSRLVGQFQADGEVKLIQEDSSTALVLRRN